MCKHFGLFQRRVMRMAGGLTLALALLGSSHARAQTTNTETISSPSLLQLENALDHADLNSTLLINCAFNGTITVNTPLFVTGNVFLTVPTNYSVTIAGSGVRIFQVQPNVTFTIQNMIVTNGQSIGTVGLNGSAGNNNGSGGGNGNTGSNAFGGAIFNQGTNYLYNCVFLFNTATGGKGGNGGAGGGGSSYFGVGGNGGRGGDGGTAHGGAIYNKGFLVVSNCTMGGNVAMAGSGGLGGTNGTGYSGNGLAGSGGTGGGAGGASIYNVGTLQIQGCTFLDNVAQGGNSQTAGDSNNGRSLNGQAGGVAEGGAIFNGGTNFIVNSTFATNQTVGGTGGTGGSSSFGSAPGNGGDGGGSYGGNIYNGPGGSLALTNCTIVGGSVIGGTNGVGGGAVSTNGVGGGNNGAIGQALGANIANAGNIFQLRNSILAYTTNGFNTYGTITDRGNNLSTDATPTFTVSTSKTNTDPLLTLLTTNGGPTLTYQPPKISPAVDAIRDTNAPLPALDQRGFPRPIGQFGDIGSVEYGTPFYTVKGAILPSSANYVNVPIVATGTGSPYTIFPDASGNYVFNLPEDTYTIVPQATNGYNFSPVNVMVTVDADNPLVINQNFVATLAYNIGGTITNLTGGATLDIYPSGSSTPRAQASTDTNNFYNFTNLSQGTYFIVPRTNSTTFFNPASATFTVPPTTTNLNFTAVPPYYPISGQIMNVSQSIIVVAKLGTSSDVFTTIQSDSSGNYTFPSLPAGSYTIIPQPTNGITFTPTSLFPTVPPGTNNQNFTAQAGALYTIGGKFSNLRAVNGVKATSTGGNYSANSDSSGNFTLANLPAGSYTVAPLAISGLTFQPASMPFTVGPNATGAVFAAVPIQRPTNSPVQITNGMLNFSIGGVPGVTYRIQVSTNLTTWQDISTNTADGDGHLTISETVSGAANQFYRVVTP